MEILTLQLFIMMRQQKWMDPVSTVVDLDPSHLFRGNFGFSQGLENNVWLNGGQVSYCNISWDRSYNSTKGSEQV